MPPHPTSPSSSIAALSRAQNRAAKRPYCSSTAVGNGRDPGAGRVREIRESWRHLQSASAFEQPLRSLSVQPARFGAIRMESTP